MATIHGGGLQIVANHPQTPLLGADLQPPRFSVFDLNGRLADLQLGVNYDPESRLVSLARTDPVGSHDARWWLPFLLIKLSLYDRIIDEAKLEDLPDAGALAALGDVMMDDNSAAAPFQEKIPAAYTYLGQFIAHDMSKMGFGPSQGKPLNFRSAALDLDSLFGPVDRGLAAPCTKWEADLGLGKTSGGKASHDDLPRTKQGESVIPDQRNDSNLALAQFHVVMIKFHQFVSSQFPGKSPEEHKMITRRHFQSVVWFDYLKRIIHPDVYNDVRDHGRAVVRTDADFMAKPFLVPTEFAAACFRFGHSMVRGEYELNASVPPASPGDLIHLTHLGGGLIDHRLPTNWVIDWQRLTSKVNAELIDTGLAWKLSRLPRWMFPDMLKTHQFETPNLAVRTLLRGRALCIPSAQSVAEQIGYQLEEAGRPTLERLTESEIADLPNACMRSRLDANHHDHRLQRDTPLWFYTLREAAHPRLSCAGNRLGPLASRIVMETIHAAIQAAPDGIIDLDNHICFRPEAKLGGRPDDPDQPFGLNDLFACVQ